MKPQIVMLMLNKFSYRVYYEDTDAGGVVYYANYLKFYERARTDLLRSLGIDQSQLLQEKQCCFVVRKCEIEYIKPAKLDDLIDVDVKISKLNGPRIVMDQTISKNNEPLSKLKVDIIFVNSENFRPKRISDDLKKLLLQ